MQTVNVRQVRASFPKVIRSLRAGESVEVTSRGKVVAVLTTPPTPYTVEAIDREITKRHNPRTRKRRAQVDWGKELEAHR